MSCGRLFQSGIGHFGDAIWATPSWRRRFGDGTSWRRQDLGLGLGLVSMSSSVPSPRCVSSKRRRQDSVAQMASPRCPRSVPERRTGSSDRSVANSPTMSARHVELQRRRRPQTSPRRDIRDVGSESHTAGAEM